MHSLALRLASISRNLLISIILSGFLAGCGLLDTPGPSPTIQLTQLPTETQTLLPDLVIKSISVISDQASECPDPDQTYSTSIQIQNIGPGPAGPFAVRANFDQQLVKEGLRPGETIEVIFPNHQPVSKVVVDVTSMVAESDESNNHMTQNLSMPTLSPACQATATPEIVLEEAAVVLEGHTAKVWDVQFSPNGRVIASGSVDDTLRLWSVEPPRLVRTMEGHPFPILRLVFTPNGSSLYTGSMDGILRAWEVATGKLIAVLDGHTGWITALAISPDAKWLASAAEDSTIRLWRLPTGAAVQIIDEGLTGVNCVVFTPDSRAIAWGESDGTLRVRMISGEWVYTIRPSLQPVTGLVFSHDGVFLIAGYGDGFVRIFQAGDGSLLQTISAHTEAVTDLAISEDGQWLVSSSNDKTLRLWKFEEGYFLTFPARVYTGHAGPVTSVALAGDNGLIVSSSDDGTVRLWNVP